MVEDAKLELRDGADLQSQVDSYIGEYFSKTPYCQGVRVRGDGMGNKRRFCDKVVGIKFRSMGISVKYGLAVNAAIGADKTAYGSGRVQKVHAGSGMWLKVKRFLEQVAEMKMRKGARDRIQSKVSEDLFTVSADWKYPEDEVGALIGGKDKYRSWIDLRKRIRDEFAKSVVFMNRTQIEEE